MPASQTHYVAEETNKFLHTLWLLVKIICHIHDCLERRETFFKDVFCIIALVTFFQFWKQDRNFLYKLHKYQGCKIFSFSIAIEHGIELFLKM